MKTDIFVILKYWKMHKKQAISILLAFVLLISYIFISLCIVRTELRRIYFDNQVSNTSTQYISNGCGRYNLIFYNISEDASVKLAEDELVEKSSCFYTVGYMGNSDCRYTAGYYPDEKSFDMTGSVLTEGKLPEKSGEIAVSELVLERLAISAEIGDTISLTSYEDTQAESGSTKEYKLVGIIKDDGEKSERETCSSSYNIYFEPIILISSEDIGTQNVQISEMVCLKDGTKLSYKEQKELENASDDYVSDSENFLMNYLSESDGYGTGGYDSTYFTTISNLNENYQGYLKSAKSNFYSYTAIAAGFLMAITLSCCLFVVLQEKIKSMRLLRRIGYSVARLRRMLLIEGILFTFFGILIGFIVAVGLYEILLQIQYHVFGLGLYRAYTAEWGIRKITYSPIAFSVFATCIVSVISYAIPIIRMKKMLYNTDKKIKHNAIAIHSLGGSIRRIFRQPLINVLQAISLILVVTVSCTALMFFSTNGKSDWQNPQILSQGKYFDTEINLDCRTYGVDCFIENQKKGLVAGLMATEVDSGYSASQEYELESSNLFSSCYSWTLLDNVYFAYPQNTEVSSALFYFDDTQFSPGEIEYYGLQDYDVYGGSSVLLVNDSILNALISTYSETLNSVSDIDKSQVVILSVDGSSPFEIGETLPLFSAYGTADVDAPFGYDLKYAEKFDATVCDVIYMNENESLLYNIMSQYSSDYILLFPTSTAQNFDLPYQNFNNVYLQYNDNTSDKEVKSLISSIYTSKSEMKAKTIADCREIYNRSMLKEYIIAFTVFGLMIILALIGYFQTLRLQVYQKTKNIRNLRALGVSRKKLCLSMYKQFIKIPILSAIISIPTVYGVRYFLKWRYDKCTDLYNLATSYPDQSSDEFITLYIKFVKQQEHFLTAYEMYKVPISGFLIALLILLLICISIYICILSKRASSISMIDGDTK
jgi:ABC-type antimicrobial peptide transport system permease subunit